MRIPIIALVFLFAGVLATAQVPVTVPPSGVVVAPPGTVVIEQTTTTVRPYPVIRVGRTIEAINYAYRRGSTDIAFIPTTLLPQAGGRAEVKSDKGATRIDARFENLEPAMRFGPEYLTYVLWAITPDGRPNNIGELVLEGSHSRLRTSTPLQAFGLIVTAEPYYAVTQPSDVVVLENAVTATTRGNAAPIAAHYELLQRGQYVVRVPAAQVVPLADIGRAPLELEEARNSLRIAEWSGAATYAPDAYQKAQDALRRAEGYRVQGVDSKTVAAEARTATQIAEDARLLAVQRQQDALRAAEQRTAAANVAEARAQAAEQATEAAQAQAEKQAAIAQQQAAQQSATAAAQQAEAARQQAELARQQAETATRQAQTQIQQTEADKLLLRTQLQEQLSQIFATRETARGLIMNMPDVLFQTGSWTLMPGAREQLAKVAGILMAHPGLSLDIEGYTDNVGSPQYNIDLSLKRANAVRDFLLAQGVSPDAITARGYGQADPVASNDTARGRQENRRVQVIVFGAPLGLGPGAATTRR